MQLVHDIKIKRLDLTENVNLLFFTLKSNSKCNFLIDNGNLKFTCLIVHLNYLTLQLLTERTRFTRVVVTEVFILPNIQVVLYFVLHILRLHCYCNLCVTHVKMTCIAYQIISCRFTIISMYNSFCKVHFDLLY